jgi:hypothetical protein
MASWPVLSITTFLPSVWSRLRADVRVTIMFATGCH